MCLWLRKYSLICVFLVVFIFVLVGDQYVFSADLWEEEKSLIEIFEDRSPSVAFIKNAALQWDWFSTYVYEVPQGVGSGFVWDDQGHIVTNFHVVYQADRIEVILSEQKSYPAKIIGISPDYDLAVLKVDAPMHMLKGIPLGSSKDLKVGQKAISIGNPFGLDYSLTTGVVSALGRSMQSVSGRKIYGVVQTDAAINPGNSGGPLLNSSGELIGVTTAIYSPSGAYAGVGFAIPVDIVKRVIPQLIEFGKVKKVGLGIILVPDYIRNRLGYQGAMILQVESSGAAKRAGLRPTRRNYFGKIIYGDVITAIDKISIKENEDLIRYFDSEAQEGDEVFIRFLRGKKEFDVQAVLQELLN